MRPKSTVFESWITVVMSIALALKSYQAATLTNDVTDWTMALGSIVIALLFMAIWMKE